MTHSKNHGYTMTGGFNFAPTGNNIVVYSGSLATLSSSGTVQQDFISNLQTVYNGTIIQSEPTINEIIIATTPEQQQLLVGNYINNHVGGITGTNTVVTEIETESQLAGWRLLDPNCQVNDIVVGTQTWAGCNSTLGNGFERGKKSDGTDGTIWSCYDYDGTNNIENCPPGATSMASNTSAITYFNAMQPDGTNGHLNVEVDNIWGKLYTWENAPSACPIGRHLPSDANWETLETTLNGGTNCRNSIDGWFCNGLGWMPVEGYDLDMRLSKTLKIPLAGFRDATGGTFYYRGFFTNLWSSTSVGTDAYNRSLHRADSGVGRYLSSQLYGFSVRCIKD